MTSRECNAVFAAVYRAVESKNEDFTGAFRLVRIKTFVVGSQKLCPVLSGCCNKSFLQYIHQTLIQIKLLEYTKHQG